MSSRRISWLIIILIILALYFPVNRLTHGGIQTILPIDKIIPLYPPAIVPYLLGDLIIVGFPIWAAVKAKSHEFEAYTISIILVAIVSYFIYVVFPTFVTRPEVSSTDVFSKMLLFVYHSDRAYNTDPSGHTFYCILSLLYLGRWEPKYRLAVIIFVILVLASTLLTRQHYVVDLLSGTILAILAYALGRSAQKKWNLKFASVIGISQ